jgi:hypothetical protein
LTPTGAVTRFPTQVNGIRALVPAPANSLWFTSAVLAANHLARLGRITTAGVVRQRSLPVAEIRGIVTGPDGTLWFTSSRCGPDEGYQVGRLRPDGTTTLYQAPAGAGNIVAGPDRQLWFSTDRGLARINPAAPPPASTPLRPSATIPSRFRLAYNRALVIGLRVNQYDASVRVTWSRGGRRVKRRTVEMFGSGAHQEAQAILPTTAAPTQCPLAYMARRLPAGV